MAGSLAFRYDRGNHSGMPTFPFHIAAVRDEPFPPVAEMATIEADDPRAALELLAKRRIVGEPGGRCHCLVQEKEIRIMADPLNVNLMTDYRLEAYGTIFNHAWARHLLSMVDGTKLDPPLFELTINWRAAVNTHGFPWMMMQSLCGLWQGAVAKKCVTSKFLRVMAAEIPKRMGGKMTNTARNRLTEVLRELSEELTTRIENDPET